MVSTKKSATGAAAAQDNNLAQAAESSLFVNSVEKAMRVLVAFDGRQRQLSLSQIAALTGLDVSATQRFTYTLTALGYLIKNEALKTYELSPKLIDFTYHYLVSSDLVNRAAPYLQQLGMETEEASNLTVLDGTDIVFVVRIVSRHVLNPNVIVGSRLPAYCTAPGLAILAALPEDESDAILARTDLVRYTPHTVADAKAIRKRLALIRKRGYAHTEEEYYLGDISTAAAITDSRGRPVGAINVAVARSRWGGEAQEKRLADLLISTATAISSRHR